MLFIGSKSIISFLTYIVYSCNLQVYNHLIFQIIMICFYEISLNSAVNGQTDRSCQWDGIDTWWPSCNECPHCPPLPKWWHAAWENLNNILKKRIVFRLVRLISYHFIQWISVCQLIMYHGKFANSQFDHICQQILTFFCYLMFNYHKIILIGTCIYLCFFLFFQVNVHLSKPLHIVTMCKHIFVVEKKW